jgi:hypothetical protein
VSECECECEDEEESAVLEKSKKSLGLGDLVELDLENIMCHTVTPSLYHSVTYTLTQSLT